MTCDTIHHTSVAARAHDDVVAVVLGGELEDLFAGVGVHADERFEPRRRVKLVNHRWNSNEIIK